MGRGGFLGYGKGSSDGTGNMESADMGDADAGGPSAPAAVWSGAGAAGRRAGPERGACLPGHDARRCVEDLASAASASLDSVVGPPRAAPAGPLQGGRMGKWS